MNWKLAGAAAMALAVAACGTNPQERVSGGAAAGAATGAGIGALGGPVGALAGAGIGGAAGAITGAATSPQDVNLGRPLWSDPEVRTPLDNRGSRTARGSGSSRRSYASAGSGSVRQVQQELASRGYNPGPIDGVMGRQTADALRAFQRANGMPETGQLDARTRQALNASGSGAATAAGTMRDNRGTMGTGAGTTPAPAAGGTSGTMRNTAPAGGNWSGGGTSATSGGVAPGGTGSTGPGGTSGVGSGNQPGTGGAPTR